MELEDERGRIMKQFELLKIREANVKDERSRVKNDQSKLSEDI